MNKNLFFDRFRAQIQPNRNKLAHQVQLRSHIPEARPGTKKEDGLANPLGAKKSIAAMIASSELPQFRLDKSLGPWSMIAIGVGAIIGAGIYSLAGAAAGGVQYSIPSALHQSPFTALWQFLRALPPSGFHHSPPAGPAIVLSFL